MSNSAAFACDRGIATAGRSGGKCRFPRLVLTTCILASSLAFIDGSVLNVALPAIGRSFHAATAEVQWVINAFLLPLSALLLVGGAAGDLYGRRRLLIGGIALFAVASLLCAVAPSLAVFLAGRGLQGLGAAMLLPNSLAILSANFSGEARGRAVGTWAAAGAIAGALAPLLGGWLVDGIGWPAIFLINLPVGIGAIVLASLFVGENVQANRPPPDWLGGAVATLALGGLTWGLTAWSAGGRASSMVLVAIGAGVALCVAFVLVERAKNGEAMVPLAMFGSRAFVGLTILTFLLYGALGGLFVLLPYALIESAGYRAIAAGSALLPLPIIIAAGSPLMGKLAARIGPKWPLTLGPLIVAAGFALGLRFGHPVDYWRQVLPFILSVSIGMAIAVAPLTTAVLSSVEETHTGTASGLNSAVSRTGGLIATALLGAVMAQRGAALIGGFHVACLAAAGASALAGLTAFLTLDSGRQRSG